MRSFKRYKLGRKGSAILEFDNTDSKYMELHTPQEYIEQFVEGKRPMFTVAWAREYALKYDDQQVVGVESAQFDFDAYCKHWAAEVACTIPEFIEECAKRFWYIKAVESLGKMLREDGLDMLKAMASPTMTDKSAQEACARRATIMIDITGFNEGSVSLAAMELDERTVCHD